MSFFSLCFLSSVVDSFTNVWLEWNLSTLFVECNPLVWFEMFAWADSVVTTLAVVVETSLCRLNEKKILITIIVARSYNDKKILSIWNSTTIGHQRYSLAQRVFVFHMNVNASVLFVYGRTKLFLCAWYRALDGVWCTSGEYQKKDRDRNHITPIAIIIQMRNSNRVWKPICRIVQKYGDAANNNDSCYYLIVVWE